MLRFENAAGDETLDYLGLALPDEIATLLTKSRDLAVRPFEYVDGDDPLAAARARRVDHIVSGRYYLEDNDQLTLAVEAQHVLQERVIWRTRITAPAGDLLAMRGRIAEGVQQGLLPALGASAVPASGSTPAHDEAYQLYLRSLALPKQPKPTERAIEMLERAVTLEPQFAPAWEALGIRYYDHGTYGAGAEPARQQSLAAHRKALELDPELISAARQIVTHRAEAGDLEGAYQRSPPTAGPFRPQRPDAFRARLSSIGSAACWRLRNATASWRSIAIRTIRACAPAPIPISMRGSSRASWTFSCSTRARISFSGAPCCITCGTNDRDAALHVARQAADEPTRRLMEPCLEGARGAALDEPVAEFVTYWQRHGDPETAYAVAPMLVYCGRPQDALRFVERAVDGSFCSYPGARSGSDLGGVAQRSRVPANSRQGDGVPRSVSPHGRRIRQRAWLTNEASPG